VFLLILLNTRLWQAFCVFFWVRAAAKLKTARPQNKFSKGMAMASERKTWQCPGFSLPSPFHIPTPAPSHLSQGYLLSFVKIYAWQQVKMGICCGRGKFCGLFPFIHIFFSQRPIWQAEQFPYKFNAPTGKRNVSSSSGS